MKDLMEWPRLMTGMTLLKIYWPQLMVNQCRTLNWASRLVSCRAVVHFIGVGNATRNKTLARFHSTLKLCFMLESLYK